MVRFKSLSSRLHPGCQEYWATWALNTPGHLRLTRVVSFLDHFHVSVSRRWCESEICALLDDGLHNRAAVGIASLSVVHFPPSAFSVGGGPDPTAYGRASLRRPHLGTRQVGAMIHVQKVALPIICSCLVNSRLWFEDLGTEWCRRCGIPVQAASVWSRHSWIFDTTSLLNSPGTLRVHVRLEPVP